MRDELEALGVKRICENQLPCALEGYYYMFDRKIPCICVDGLEYKTSIMEKITSQLDYLTYVDDPLT